MLDDSREIYERKNYTNKDIDCLYNTHIREYDMKSAGMNVLYREGGINKREYDFLKSLGKKERVIRIGCMLRDDKILNDTLNNGLNRVRKEFIDSNGLDESDILSIKNDAIFVINKQCNNLKFDNIVFTNKNNYTSYYYLDKKEFYYNKIRGEDILHVKGINDENYKLHKDYMLKMLCDIFRSVEVSNNKNIFRKIKNYALAYMNRELDIGYYRELNNSSLFRLNKKLLGNSDYGITHYDNVEDLKIQYNYMAYILELINLFF